MEQTALPRILIFSFRGGISRRVLELIDLPGVDKRVVGSGIILFKAFAIEIALGQYDAVVGLGGTSRGKYIRLEQACSNRFRSKTISPSPAWYDLPGFMVHNDSIRPGHNIGHSYCNAVSYQIMHWAKPTKFNFIHIPNKIDPIAAANNISDAISQAF